MIKKYVLTPLLLLLAFVKPIQAQHYKAVDSIFSEWDNTDTPGAALGIIKDGNLIYFKGYGLANLEYDIPITDSTIFRIGSTSKQFTAACIILLAKQKKLSLEDKLISYFPEFPEYAEKITIRDLLNHTSGIRDYLTISYLKGLESEDYYRDKNIMDWLINQNELNFEPGQEYKYSNSGYWLLGKIVEKVSGKNMADFAQEEIFIPLGMYNTHFHNDHNKIVKNRASGYDQTDDGFKISMTTLDMIGDGGIFTNIKDIKTWDDAYYNSEVLNKEFWDLMTQKGILNNGEVLDYASGLFIGEYKGLKTVRHAGGFVGFKAELLRFPEQKLSIVIFANRKDARPQAIANQVADIILKNSFIENDGKIQNEIKEMKNNSFIILSEAEVNKHTGNYWNDNDLYARKIYVKNDTLRYYRNEGNESKLMPISKNEFKMMNTSNDVLVRFDNYTTPSMTVIINKGKPVFFNKYQPKAYTSEKLAEFQGNYYSEEIDVSYSLKLENEILMLYINGNKKSPLKSLKKKNIFKNDNYGVFQFTNDQQGNIVGFQLDSYSGRAKNLKFERQ